VRVLRLSQAAKPEQSPPAPLADGNLLEKREVDAAVCTVLNESRVLGEVIGFTVLQNKEAVGLQQPAREDDVGQFRYLRQNVWRVSKDEVELFTALGHILENVAANGQCRRVLQFVKELLDETMMANVKLHAYDTSAASADEFKRNAACAREEVESRRSLAEVDVALQDVEKVLLGEVRRRTCREAARHLEMPAFVFASDDAH